MNLCTLMYIYTSMLTHRHVYTVFYTTDCLMVKSFSKYKVIRLLSFDHSVAMVRANGHDNVLTVKIAAPELTKKTVDLTN